MRLHVVDDEVPTESIDTLRSAADARGVELVHHRAGVFVFDAANRARAGDLLFRPAVSLRAMRVEQYLFQPGVATFYQGENGVFRGAFNSLYGFEAAGVPVPRSVYLNTTERRALDFYVEQLGGYPVVLKVLGNSSGIGVMRLDSAASLYSVVDYVTASSPLPVLSAYVDDAEHWRCVVVGGRVVASYLNPREASDFRTYGSSDPEDVRAGADEDLAEVACLAVAATGVEFGGVDVLRHESGRCYVLESNFPCYYAHAQTVGGVDVTGAMLDHLIAKAEALAAARTTA